MGLNVPARGAKVGEVKMYPVDAVPVGWLRCNGAAVSRDAYALLFAAIGTAYGAGDGAATFNLPDLRGEFIRGADQGRGVDAGRAVGSWQADELKSHTHSYRSSNAAAGTVMAAVRSSALGDTGTATEAKGGAETRPRNVALLACIVY